MERKMLGISRFCLITLSFFFISLFMPPLGCWSCFACNNGDMCFYRMSVNSHTFCSTGSKKHSKWLVVGKHRLLEIQKLFSYLGVYMDAPNYALVCLYTCEWRIYCSRLSFHSTVCKTWILLPICFTADIAFLASTTVSDIWCVSIDRNGFVTPHGMYIICYLQLQMLVYWMPFYIISMKGIEVKNEETFGTITVHVHGHDDIYDGLDAAMVQDEMRTNSDGSLSHFKKEVHWTFHCLLDAISETDLFLKCFHWLCM